MDIFSILWPAVAIIVFPVLSLLLTQKLLRLKKVSSKRQAVLYIIAILSTVAAWYVSQFFLPLVYIETLSVMFLGFWLVGKYTLLKSAIATAVYSLFIIAFSICATYVLLSFTHFS